MIGTGVYAAGTDEEAQHLYTSAQQQILSLIRGHPGKLPPPVKNMNQLWSPVERAALDQRSRYTAVGAPETVRSKLQQLITATEADEIILVGQIYDHKARLHSFEIAAGILQRVQPPALH